MLSEITVSIRDEEKTLKKKFLIYESYRVSEDDLTIQSCIQETLKNFSSEPSKVTVKITMHME
jgi:hypothetical protein